MTRSATTRLPEGFEATAPADPVLFTPEACRFLADLVRTFAPRITALLSKRAEVQALLDDGARPDFLAETREIREGDWTVAPIPDDLADRRVEITGPVDRKMIVNALNSGANVFMADFEDSLSPTWKNVLEGQRNLVDAVDGTIRHEDAATGKIYSLRDRTAVLFVRPRGLHLVESHLCLDGRAVPASLFDFGLYFFHTARLLRARGRGPYFYLPKMESHHEARLWNDVFVRAQDALGIPRGTIRATALVETLPAAFEMHEILWELREHSAGLNCGRWDYIFSYIKKLGAHAAFVIPDRAEVGMTQPFLRAYTQLLVQTCHRRGIHAMGGMAAQIPIRGDEVANRAALDLVRADKLREAKDGHDGTWVAHPGLVPIAREVFDAHMPRPNQIDVKRDDVRVGAADLLRVPEGPRTERGLREDVRVGIRYLESWLRGAGCVPIDHRMEDAATAEISRMQVWQWLRHETPLDDGPPLGAERVRAVVDDEMREMQGGRFALARTLFERVATAPAREDFLTLPAYEVLQMLEKEDAC